MSDYLEDSKWEHTSYLEESIRTGKLRETVKYCAMALSKHKFDAIAFRGLSGALIAPAVALTMNKEMIAVRKECEFDGKDSTHSCHKVEGFKATKRYIIIDDLICSGRTAKAIVEAVKEFAPMAECVGLLESNYVKSRTHKWMDEQGNIIRGCDLYVQMPGSYSGFGLVEFTKHPTPRPIGVPKKLEPKVETTVLTL